MTPGFLPDLLALILHKPAERIHEDTYYDGCQEGESEVDASNSVDASFVFRLLEVVIEILRNIRLMLDDLSRAVLGATSGQHLVCDGEVCVQVGGEHRRTDDVANDRVALEEEEEYTEELDNNRLRVNVLYGRQSVSYLEGNIDVSEIYRVEIINSFYCNFWTFRPCSTRLYLGEVGALG